MLDSIDFRDVVDYIYLRVLVGSKDLRGVHDSVDLRGVVDYIDLRV